MEEKNRNQDTGHDGNDERLTENSRYRSETDLEGYDRLRDEQMVDDLWYRIANEGRD